MHSLRSFALVASIASTFPLGAATAETAAGPPAALPTGAIVQIAGAALLPERLHVANGQQVVFRNDSPALARVELDLARGAGIRCASDGETPVRGRKFVVASGASLACEAPPAAVEYRVFRIGTGSVVESEGRIEPESGS
jgi:hypothetical protein